MGLYKKHGIILSIFLACGMFVRLDSSQTSSRNRPSNKQPELEILVAELNTLWPNLNEKMSQIMSQISKIHTLWGSLNQKIDTLSRLPSSLKDTNSPGGTEASDEGLEILRSTLRFLKNLNLSEILESNIESLTNLDMNLTNLDMDLTNYPNKFPHLVSNGNNFGRDRRILALRGDIRR